MLVDRSARRVGAARLAHVAQALQTQVDRDFGPAWGVRATVSAAAGTSAPVGAWPISVVDAPRGGLGVHLDAEREPCAEVRAGKGWTLDASHLLLEMIADPGGCRFMEGPSIGAVLRRRSVWYLVEVCHPCRPFHYVIDGVEVADFVTPDYYGMEGTAVDFLRLLRRPLEVPRGGSLCWQDPGDGHWYQQGPDGVCHRSGDPIRPDRNPREERTRAFPAVSP